MVKWVVFTIFLFGGSIISYPAVQAQKRSIYDFKVVGLSGDTIDFADFKGKKILTVLSSLQFAGDLFAHWVHLVMKYHDKFPVFIQQEFGEIPGNGIS